LTLTKIAYLRFELFLILQVTGTKKGDAAGNSSLALITLIQRLFVLLTLDTLPTTTMSLDKNLFTLSFTPHQDNPNVIDLVDPSGTVHYRKQRVTGISEYKIELYGMSFIDYLFIEFA